MKRSEVPSFGVLEGVRVLTVGQVIAGPFASSMMADFGATVVHVESTISPDVARWPGTIQEQDRRNQLNISFNMTTPEGREILFAFLKETDILIENAKGGQWERWGLPDTLLWEQNPALVIIHVSGFGQTGVAEYVTRPAWDMIGQAFGCFTFQNGIEDEPACLKPTVGDALTGLYTLGSALAAYVRALKTGKGESVDVAQFEVGLRGMAGNPLEYFTRGTMPLPRTGGSYTGAGSGVYKCSDGFVCCCMVGPTAMKKGIPFLGFEFPSELFPAHLQMVMKSTEGGRLLDEKFIEYCSTRTCAEVDAEFTAHGIPVSPVYDFSTTENHPHYLAREVYTTWKNIKGETVKGVNIVPKMKQAPGMIWRGAPGRGQDNEDLLAELGYSEEAIKKLYDARVLAKG